MYLLHKYVGVGTVYLVGRYTPFPGSGPSLVDRKPIIQGLAGSLAENCPRICPQACPLVLPLQGPL